MKSMKLFTALLIVMVAASVARTEYTQAEWERLKTGEILVSEVTVMTPDGGQRTQFQAKLYVKAPRQVCWKILRDYNTFGEFMPSLKRCTILKQEGDVYWVRYETKILWKEVNYHLKLVGVEKYKRIEYKLDDTRKNDIKGADGYWIFDDTPDGKGTILTYSSNIDSGIPAPEKLVKNVAKTQLPKIVENVRKRIESGGKWKKSED